MAMRGAAFAVVLFSCAEAGRLLTKRSDKRSLSSCGVKGASKPALDDVVDISIVNGANATECEWRWQVGLRSSISSRPYCGGSLIHPEWVLTAAHCMGGNPNFNVIAGNYEVQAPDGNEQSRWAAQIFKHPNYDEQMTDFDYALVRLESPFDITDCVGTVCLPTEGNDVPPETQCWTTGWGALQSGGQFAEKLQEGRVSTLSLEDCRDTGYGAKAITDNMLCAQGRTADGGIVDACQGDSGGPLVCESDPDIYTLYGATSWGTGCANETFPGVFARVHEAVEWIEETIEINQGKPPPPIVRCPDFAFQINPDSDGDCRCKSGEYCSRSNGDKRDCPTSAGIAPYGGLYFSPDCHDCLCYPAK